MNQNTWFIYTIFNRHLHAEDKRIEAMQLRIAQRIGLWSRQEKIKEKEETNNTMFLSAAYVIWEENEKWFVSTLERNILKTNQLFIKLEVGNLYEEVINSLSGIKIDWEDILKMEGT